MTGKMTILGGLGMLGLALAAMLLASCRDPKSAAGFALPDGDIEQGRAAFARLNCTSCHVIVGETFPEVPAGGMITIPLSGEVNRVRTYGQLVTSIVNPQHIVSSQYEDKYTDAEGRSLMPDFNKTMTVDEMVNLVAYLQSHYKLKVPDPAFYPGM
ncbi:MAG TPA: c-type cytochrome [Opitutaceae bacterium]